MTRFRRLVRERGWTSFETFSRQFVAAAQRAAEHEDDPRLRRVAVSRRSFDRWMHGGLKGTPRREPALVLRHMFGMSVERLFETVDDAHLISPPGTVALAQGVESHLGGHDLDDPLQVVGQAIALTTSQSNPALLVMAEESIHSIVDRYEALGPQRLVGEARLVRRMLHVMLAGHQPPRMCAELFGLTGRVAGLLGYMAANLGVMDAARAYCTEAELLAREVGDVPLEMWALGTRSYALYYEQRYAEADAAARAGITLAPSNAQAIRLLANGRARALARMGDRRGAEQAIGQAIELSEREPSLPEGMSPCIAFAPYSMARSLSNAVTAHLSLDDSAQVLAYAAQINELVELSDSRWSRALVGLDVATALVRHDAPEIGQAMALGRSALRATAEVPIQSVWQRARELHEQVSRWRDEPEVGDFAEELQAWRSRLHTDVIMTDAPAVNAL
ncbi:hypothetical protein [Nonomuraea sp. NPDC046570]|uniref:hypothetical protein n=1 Tax=Nonomuraea sp. NPDC046570 TaxID=3155255 RepID=UPI0033F3A649